MRLLIVAGTLLVAACLTLSAGAGLRANSQSFSDSTGEDGAAPDITTMVVSNDDNGLITFQINISNRPALTGDMAISIVLDIDSELGIGNTSLIDGVGEDYIIDLTSGGARLGKWNGTEDDYRTPQSSLVSSYSPTGATIKVNTRDLGGTSSFPQLHIFGFVVVAASGIVWNGNTRDVTNAHSDFAPDLGKRSEFSSPTFRYTFDSRPPTVTPPKAKPVAKKKPPLCKKGQKSTKKKACRKK
jgi:hypothetical protein